MNRFSVEAMFAQIAAEVAEKDKIINYVKSLDFNAGQAIDFEQMAYELNLTNPIIKDLLEIWVEMRFRRMNFELRVMKKLRRIKR